MAITVELKKDERNLILEAVPELERNILARIRFALAEGGRFRIALEDDAFHGLVKAVGRAARAQGNRKTRRALARLLARLERQKVPVEELFPEEMPPFSISGDLDAQAQELLHRAEREGRIRDLDDATRLLQAFSDRYNQTPQAAMGGCSPEQVYRLLNADWESPDSALLLDEHVPLEAVQDAPIFADARFFLRRLEEEDGTKVTKQGNLNRAFVRQMIGHMETIGERAEWMLSYKTAWNEGEVTPLICLRHLLLFAKLIRKYKGQFVITKKGEALLQDAEAGRLYARLFHTQFRVFNLDSMDGFAPLPELQGALSFSLYMLHCHTQDWTPVDDAMDKLFLPTVHKNVPFHPLFGEEMLNVIAVRRFMRPLTYFGLLEYEAPDYPDTEPLPRLRITPLFDRFLHFHLP